MKWSDVKGYLMSVALASAILFGVGYHPTVDAIILTVVWVFLIFGGLAMVGLTLALIAIRSHDNKYDADLGKTYEGISKMHNTGIVKNIISFALMAYWIYALAVQVWTVTAVVYVLYVIYVRVFAYLTKDLAKDYFLNRLKGEGMAK